MSLVQILIWLLCSRHFITLLFSRRRRRSPTASRWSCRTPATTASSCRPRRYRQSAWSCGPPPAWWVSYRGQGRCHYKVSSKSSSSWPTTGPVIFSWSFVGIVFCRPCVYQLSINNLSPSLSLVRLNPICGHKVILVDFTTIIIISVCGLLCIIVLLFLLGLVFYLVSNLGRTLSSASIWLVIISSWPGRPPGTRLAPTPPGGLRSGRTRGWGSTRGTSTHPDTHRYWLSYLPCLVS